VPYFLLLHRCLCLVTPPVSPTVLRPLLSESSASLRRSRLLLLTTMPPSLLPALLCLLTPTTSTALLRPLLPMLQPSALPVPLRSVLAMPP
jgi:hypothetical protein